MSKLTVALSVEEFSAMQIVVPKSISLVTHVIGDDAWTKMVENMHQLRIDYQIEVEMLRKRASSRVDPTGHEGHRSM